MINYKIENIGEWLRRGNVSSAVIHQHIQNPMDSLRLRQIMGLITIIHYALWESHWYNIDLPCSEIDVLLICSQSSSCCKWLIDTRFSEINTPIIHITRSLLCAFIFHFIELCLLLVYLVRTNWVTQKARLATHFRIDHEQIIYIYIYYHFLNGSVLLCVAFV